MITANALRSTEPSVEAMARATIARLPSLRALIGDAERVTVTMPAPIAPVWTLLDAAAAHDAAYVWEPPAGRASSRHARAWAGAGVAAELVGSGPARLEQVQAAAAALWQGTCCVNGSGVGPRLVGGLAFAPGAADKAPWRGFGDARFVLPRWSYTSDDHQGWLVLAVAADELDDVDAIGRELDDVLAALAAPALELRGGAGPRPEAEPSEPREARTRGPGVAPEAARGIVPGPAHVVTRSSPDVPGWHRLIDGIRAAIGDGRADKIVAARSAIVELAEPIDTAAVVRRLGDRHPECHRFAIRVGDRTFVGATPERLVRLADRDVDTDALAGSIARGPGDDAGALASQLIASGKDVGEHLWVVKAIEAVLAPRCEALDVPSPPGIRSLRHVLHLHTPIRGRLRAHTHVLELAGALHPTPAVGGTPTDAAVAWIASHEEPRGWYASPVGWFDAAGDGELVMAIRSGLLRDRVAQVWAGAGIVWESDAERELDETEVKLRALLGALGVT